MIGYLTCAPNVQCLNHFPCGNSSRIAFFNLLTWKQVDVMSKDVFDAIKRNLTPDLLKSGYSGHCYVASEAYYHIVGKHDGFRPKCMKINGVTHWWLQRGSNIIDLTSDQFNFQPNYWSDSARGRGFLTKGPSKRARVLIDRVCEDLGLDSEMIYEAR